MLSFTTLTAILATVSVVSSTPVSHEQRQTSEATAFVCTSDKPKAMCSKPPLNIRKSRFNPNETESSGLLRAIHVADTAVNSCQNNPGYTVGACCESCNVSPMGEDGRNCEEAELAGVGDDTVSAITGILQMPVYKQPTTSCSQSA